MNTELNVHLNHRELLGNRSSSTGLLLSRQTACVVWYPYRWCMDKLSPMRPFTLAAVDFRTQLTLLFRMPD